MNFNTLRNKLTALSNINHLILTYKPMRPVSISRLHEEFQKLSEKIEQEKSQTQQKRSFWW